MNQQDGHIIDVIWALCGSINNCRGKTTLAPLWFVSRFLLIINSCERFPQVLKLVQFSFYPVVGLIVLVVCCLFSVADRATFLAGCGLEGVSLWRLLACSTVPAVLVELFMTCSIGKITTSTPLCSSFRTVLQNVGRIREDCSCSFRFILDLDFVIPMSPLSLNTEGVPGACWWKIRLWDQCPLLWRKSSSHNVDNALCVVLINSMHQCTPQAYAVYSLCPLHLI